MRSIPDLTRACRCGAQQATYQPELIFLFSDPARTYQQLDRRAAPYLALSAVRSVNPVRLILPVEADACRRCGARREWICVRVLVCSCADAICLVASRHNTPSLREPCAFHDRDGITAARPGMALPYLVGGFIRMTSIGGQLPASSRAEAILDRRQDPDYPRAGARLACCAGSGTSRCGSAATDARAAAHVPSMCHGAADTFCNPLIMLGMTLYGLVRQFRPQRTHNNGIC